MPHRKLDRHLGIRGWTLPLCAAVWWLVGLGVLLRAANDGDPALLHLYLPACARVFAWWAGAALAVYGAVGKMEIVAWNRTLTGAEIDAVRAAFKAKYPFLP